MWRKFILIGLVLVTVVTMMANSGQSAFAGQSKRLNASGLAVGGLIQVISSPQNQGAAMEMDTYEVLTAGGNHRFRILSNGTGQVLNLRLIGVNGSIITSCTAAVGGTCTTPSQALIGNLLFQVIVATQNGAPVNPGSNYRFAVQKQ
jgi:hypothetical protein